MSPEALKELDELLDGLLWVPGLGQKKMYEDMHKNLEQAITAWASHLVEAAEMRNLSNLARAAGILQGLGHPDRYLERELERLKLQAKEGGERSE